jgi:hypothetical protein
MNLPRESEKVNRRRESEIKMIVEHKTTAF